jgi:hypothetical protein
LRRTLLLWLLLFAVYAATLGLGALGSIDYGGDEPHYLLATKSIVEDGKLDDGTEASGRLHDPHGLGFPLLIAPAYAVGGAKGVELFLAAVAALAVALAYRLALRVVPDPWALGAAGAVGISPPFLAYGTAVYPELGAAAALAGAALLAVRLDTRPSRRHAFACFVLLAALPWLGARFVPGGAVVGYFAARGLWRARRRTLAVGTVELALFSVAVYVGVNEALYGGPTPYSASDPGGPATGAASPVGYLERSYRLVALFLDRGYGLLRWAPVLLLTFAGLWLLWRSYRDRLARAMPQLREVELTAGLCAAALGAQLLVAAFLAPTMFGEWFPARHLLATLPLAIPLVAWGLRHAPRVGTALAVLTLAASAWLYVDVRRGTGSLVADRPEAPFGPLTDVFPAFQQSGGWPFWLAGAIGVALGAFIVRELLRKRRVPEAPGVR